VVNRVVAKFVERQVGRRAEVTMGTVTALRGQVGQLRPALAQLEAAVRDFKISHDGSLPEQQEHNLRTLDQTTMEINILSTNLDLGEEHRRQLLLGAMSPMRHQEQLLQSQLHDALTKYTPEHPEVARIRAELEKVTASRVTDEAQLRANAAGNPEIAALGREIDRQRAQMATLRKTQEEARARLAEMARNGQSLAEMATDLDATKQKYQAALSKLHDAELAAAVENNLRGQRFETVEQAAQPAHPIRPDRPLLGLGALLAAILLGLGVGFARDFADPSIHAPEEVVALGRGAPLDVLACVPELVPDPEAS
jgi:uncharacterized protein involved in exopolysaccharide biosynthesis